MPETHIISALRTRREEIASEIRGLSAALGHLDATIRLFEVGKPPKARQHLSRGVLGLLRDGEEMTAGEIAERLDAPVKRVMGTLCYQRGKGRVRCVKKAGEDVRWEVVG